MVWVPRAQIGSHLTRWTTMGSCSEDIKKILSSGRVIESPKPECWKAINGLDDYCWPIKLPKHLENRFFLSSLFFF